MKNVADKLQETWFKRLKQGTMMTEATIRAALFDVLDSGWQCSSACDIKHPWSFDPNDESDSESKHRTRFIDAVIERIKEMG